MQQIAESSLNQAVRFTIDHPFSERWMALAADRVQPFAADGCLDTALLFPAPARLPSSIAAEAVVRAASVAQSSAHVCIVCSP